MKRALFKFQLKGLIANWYRIPFLLTFIFLQIAFVLTGAETIIDKAWFMPVSVIIFSLIITQNFHETLKEDFEDGSLFWLLSQGIAPALYFLITASAFCVINLTSTLAVVAGTWILKGSDQETILMMGLAFALIGIQNICIGGALSISAITNKTQGIHMSLPLCLVPLGLPSLLLISGIDQGNIGLSAINILIGLTLSYIAAGITLFTYALKS
jgi:hypothetical protein